MTTPLARATGVPVAAKISEPVHSKWIRAATASPQVALGIRSWDQSEGSALRLILSLLAAALMTAATGGLAWIAISHRFDPSAAPDVQSGAIYSGEYDHGAPVYRLPSIMVIAQRNAAMATTEREEHARASEARSKVTERPQA